MDRDLDTMFQEVADDANAEYHFDFTTEDDLDNIASMSVFVEDNDLGGNVEEDDGTLVFLFHEDYDFQLAVGSFGLGDFFSHGITISKAEV